jgi:L-fuconolactonase
MRIDAHQHFWTFAASELPWIGARMEVLRRDFQPRDLAPLLAAQRFDGCIAVQARPTPKETARLCTLAREHGFVRGVVGWIDMCAPDVADQLDDLDDEPHLVGLRHVVQDEPDDRFVLRADFQRGIAALAGRGLAYDLLIHPRHLAPALELAKRFPEQPFVLDHLGKPFIKDRRLAPWEAGVRALARRPNATCKVSGMVTEADRDAWTPGDLEPFLDVVLEAFGPERLLFGSDWPVCLLAASYARVVDAVQAWADDRLGEPERAALFGGNAVRVYGL